MKLPFSLKVAPSISDIIGIIINIGPAGVWDQTGTHFEIGPAGCSDESDISFEIAVAGHSDSYLHESIMFI